MSKPKVLAIGAGAIGKSISGYVFSKGGFEVVYADVVDAVIDDINTRGGYTVHTAKIDGGMEEEWISGLRAVKSGSPEAEAFALEADVICTAVGPVGLRACMPTLAGWLKKRNGKKLIILLFENDVECKHNMEAGLTEALGELPDWLQITKTSIERMTKPFSPAPGVFDCLAEDFIPVIAAESELGGSVVDNEYFMLVEDTMAYYYRKLYTNNLGHALLGYIGSYYGYEDTTSAMEDDGIRELLFSTLRATGKMLTCEYGCFTDEAIAKHLATLEKRYRNENLRDNLARLARDPARKIGPEERIIGAARLCEKHGIETDGILTVLAYALLYRDPEDKGAEAVRIMLEEKGRAAVFTELCGMTPGEALFEKACAVFDKLTDKLSSL